MISRASWQNFMLRLRYPNPMGPPLHQAVLDLIDELAKENNTTRANIEAAVDAWLAGPPTKAVH